MTDSFAHLHVHTEYSLLDGAARIGDIVAAAVADGQPAIGITDHGNMYGVVDFYRACREQGIKPVLGTEAYMAHESRSERPTRRGRLDDSGGETEGGRKLYYHLTLLAENATGYRNLIQVASRAFLEGYYYKPRVDWEVLADHNEGLIATTGCLGGQVLQALLRDDYEGARERAGRLQDIFGRDNLFVELQDHGIPEQQRTNPQLIRLAEELGAPLLATNDSHYTCEDDAVSHDALLCVQTGSLVSDEQRFRFHGTQHYVKSAGEMRGLFRDVPSACDNTLWIAERCDVEIEFGKPQLPDFPLPDGFKDDDAYLEHLAFEGARKRWGDTLPDSVVERLAYELKIIGDMGFSAYFLITWDLIRYARERSIRVGPGRGSAAGCAVAYALEITDLDPIRYDLLFERFLNPSRSNMPDIDMDFDSRHRDELIRYAAERYGRDHVAQIITFSQIKARAAVRDAARVLGHPYGLGDRVAKAMPQLIMGRDTPLAACLVETDEHSEGFKMAADLRQMYETDNDVREVVDVARGLEGLRRQDSIHAAAVVITKEPLTEYLPIQRKPESGQDPADAPVVTQFEMHAVEDLGLLKMDFLGLRNLDVITDTLALVEATRGEVIDIDNVQLDDAATFDLLARGDTIGVFQLESGPMRSLMRSLAPTGFQDVAALVALYRPGPMSTNMHNDYADRKNGRQPVSYFHPDAEELLADTYGLMIYQESVMRVAQKFAGYSMADADNLRKACGKKDRDLMQKERKGFVSGCEATGYGGALGDDLFDDIEQFADYAFNKSHSYGYGYIAYQIAFLKANYPVEYMAALLTSVKSNLDKAAVYLNECRIMGIDVGVPDINTARSDFHALPGDQVGANGSGSGHRIAFGLSAVRNVGEGLVDLLLAERDSGGPFADFYDFVERCDSTVLNKRTVESLIKAGAFDTFGHPRQGLLLAHEQVIEHTLARRREHDMGVMSLFGEGDSEPLFDERTVISDVEFDKTVRLAFEKEMLGLYVSDHPLSGYEVALRRRCDMAIADLADVDDGMQHTIGGVLTNLQKKWTRKGDLMAVFDLEDLGGSVEVTVFPKTMAEHGHKLEEDAIVLVRGRLDDRRGAVPKILCHEVEVVEMGDLPSSRPVRLRLPIDRVSRSTVDELKELLSAHPGDAEVYLHLGDRQVLRLPADYCVNPSGGLVGELRVLLGAEAVVTG
ncbi:MAG: DNA polymerase III subunit alpha [Acidimicrobiales bacterium]|nr:DNA polymerase III subunit alpha [Acidimicrobiales bacterium]MDP7124667.1 DNA polymerase III subunit alpha [Acidimicrobiales bacterium]MDP7352729.1 DNA polymerase III subunit alpha [Acidimicrobiales bacterium]